MIDLLIIGFACISIAAFAVTKEKSKANKNCEVEICQELKEEEK